MFGAMKKRSKKVKSVFLCFPVKKRAFIFGIIKISRTFAPEITSRHGSVGRAFHS